MAYVPGFEHDLYISYSHLDDQNNWVSNLHRELEFRLSMRLGVHAALWRDPKLAGGDSFQEELRTAISGSAVFLVLVSPGWWHSEWCQTELRHFLQIASAGWPGAVVGNRHRALKAILLPTEGDSPLPETLGYDFYSYEADKSYARILEPDSREFSSRVDRLAFAIADLLRVMRQVMSAAPAPQPVASARPLAPATHFVLRPSEASGDGPPPPRIFSATRDAGARAWLDRAPTTAELAEVVSLAARVEPALLRLARLHLGLRVEREAEVWFSPLVEIRNANGITFFPEALDILRQRLRRAPERLDLAVRLTMDSARQAALPPATRLQEQITCEATPQSATALRQVLVAIVRENRKQLASWAAGALARLPETVRQHSDAGMLAQAVKASGVSSVPGFESTPAPPTWMTPSPPPVFSAGLRLYADRLEFRMPPVPGDNPLVLPEQIWVSWRMEKERRTQEVRLARGRTIRVPFQGEEIRLDTAAGASYLIQAKTSLGPRRAVFVGARDPTSALASFIARELEARGHNVYTGSDETEAQQRDYCVSIDGSGLNSARSNCRQVIIAASPAAPRVDPRNEEYAIDFGEVRFWDNAMARLLHDLESGDPSLGGLEGVPELPSTFIRPPALEQVRDLLLDPTNPYGASFVNVWGEAGSGKTVFGAAIARDCVVRRHFVDGIRWHDPGKTTVSAAGKLLVIVDPAHWDVLPGQLQLEGEACALTLSDGYVYENDIELRWPDDLLHQLFRSLTGAESPPEASRLWDGRPGLVEESALWWKALGNSAKLFFEYVARLNIKDVLLAASELQSAFRIVQSMDPPTDFIERATRRDQRFDRVSQVLSALSKDLLLPKNPVSPRFARAAHERLVRSWEVECAGDWILSPREPYFDKYLPYHLEQAGREKEADELRMDLDWLERTGDHERARSTPAFVERSRFLSQGPWRWLHVLGTARHEIPAVQQWTAERLGREAARRHFGLATGGCPGVDYVAARGFVAELERIEIGVVDRYLLHIVEPGKKPEFPRGSINVEHDWKAAMVERSNTVILLGGMGGTYEAGAEAKRRGRLVIPLGSTGGDAEKMSLESPNPDPIFDAAIENEIQAGRIAAAVVAYVAGKTSSSIA